MRTRPTLITLYRCTMALTAVILLGLAAGCAWLLMPAHAEAASAEQPAALRSEAVYLEARLLIANDQFARAAERLELLRQDPGCPSRVFLALGEAYIRQRRLDDGRKVLDEATRRFPGDVELKMMHARLLGEAGNLDEGLAELDEALKLQPQRESLLQLMSEMRMDRIRKVKSDAELKAQVGEMIKIYERMLEHRQGTDRVAPLLILSSLYLRTDSTDLAVERGRQAVALQPREPRCHLTLAQALEATGRPDEALEVYRQVLRLDSQEKEARERIETLLGDKTKSGARLAFGAGLAADFPDDNGLQALYGRVLLANERWKEAEAQLSAIARRWPADYQSRLNLALARVRLGRTEQAVADVRQLSADNPDHAPVANLSLAEALITMGDRDRAIKVLEAFEKTKPADNENLVLAQAALLMEADETGRAIAALEAFNNKNPGNYNAALLLVQAHARQKGYAKAHGVLAALPEKVRQQKRDDLLRLSADLYRREKQWPKALEALQTLMAGSAVDVSVLLDAGTVHQEMGHYSEAERLFRKAVTLAPEDAETYNTLGYFYAETNQKLDEAKRLVDKALELSPNAGNIVDSLGWVYYKQGNFEGAAEQLSRAVELMKATPDPVVYEHLGDALEKLGRIEDARKAWRKALELDDESASVREKLGRHGEKVSSEK